MNAEHPARLFALPATMLLFVAIAPSARADRAENAFVAVRAVGADVERKGGRNFTANEDCEVEIAAHPGWVLLTPSRVRVTKNQSPRYRVRSVSNEDEGEGDVERIEVEQILHHEDDPTVLAQVSVGGPYVYAAPDEGMDVVLSGTAAATPGTHVIETRTTVYKNGAVVSTRSSISDPFPLELDQWSWEWSLGPENGTTNVQSFSTAPVFLTHGTYTARGKVSGSSSQCAACTKTDTASTNFPVSLLSVTCDPWIGQDRTGDPSAPYESPKVTATASLDPVNPAVKKVTWGGVNKCEKREPKDWSIMLWTEDREKASDTYLGEKVTASVAGATATTNFTIVKVNLVLDGLSEEEEATAGAIIPLYEQLEDKSSGNLNRYEITCWPALPDGDIKVSASVPADLQNPDLKHSRSKKTVGASSSTIHGYVYGSAVSTDTFDNTLTAKELNSGAKDGVDYSTHHIELEQNALIPPCRNRERMGVGEAFVAKVLPEISAEWTSSSFFWNLDAPPGEKISHGISMLAQALDQAGKAFVSAKIGKASLACPIEIVAPALIQSSCVESNKSYPAGEVAVFGMIAPIVIGPTDVSFFNVAITELECPAEAPVGYYATLSPLLIAHSSAKGANRTIALGVNNDYGDDIKIELRSDLKLSDLEEENGYEWNIPMTWQVIKVEKAVEQPGVKRTKKLSRSHQFPFKNKEKLRIFNTGIATAAKFKIVFSRTINDVRTETMELE